MARRDPTVWLLCGLAFAGKSTLASLLAARTGAAILSLDDINAERDLHGGVGIPTEEWAATHREALRRLDALLEQGRSVIVDDTNCFRWLRDSYRDAARVHGAPATVIHLDVPLDAALARLRANEASPERAPVTEAILRDLARDFEPPAPDETTIVCPADETPDRWVARILATAGPTS